MRHFSFIMLFSLLIFSGAAEVNGGIFSDILKGFGSGTEESVSNENIISGLKEALSIGVDNAVKEVSQPNGYFGNEMIKILMPEKIQNVADTLSKIGFQEEVDDFISSMNSAAERAAPKATTYFMDAIKEMSFDDAGKILKGSDTAATDYFREKTSEKIYAAFKPVISDTMDTVGVTKNYKQMMGKYEAIPFIKKESMDLDHYVTNKALDGLFKMVGDEEKKIRTDPTARVTDLLKTVFTK